MVVVAIPVFSWDAGTPVLILLPLQLVNYALDLLGIHVVAVLTVHGLLLAQDLVHHTLASHLLVLTSLRNGLLNHHVGVLGLLCGRLPGQVVPVLVEDTPHLLGPMR